MRCSAPPSLPPVLAEHRCPVAFQRCRGSLRQQEQPPFEAEVLEQRRCTTWHVPSLLPQVLLCARQLPGAAAADRQRAGGLQRLWVESARAVKCFAQRSRFFSVELNFRCRSAAQHGFVLCLPGVHLQ